MQRGRRLSLLAVVGMVIAVIVAAVAVQAMGGTQASVQEIKVVDDNGRLIEISPIVPERKGEPRLLSSEGKWTLEALGYSDLELPCAGQFEAVVVDYLLPRDAAQGPERWYILNCEVDIQFSAASEKGEVQVSASTNGAPAGKVRLQTERLDDCVVARWIDSGTERQVVLPGVAHLSYSIYLRDADLAWAGVKPGNNVLAFTLAQYQGAKVKALRVCKTTSVEVTTLPPPYYGDTFSDGLPKLSAEDEAKAVNIVMSDTTMQQVLQGKSYNIEYVGPCEWPSSAGDARLDLIFDTPYQIQLDWPWPPTPIREEPMSGNFWVRRMTIAIDLEKETVTGISPCGQLLPPANATPNPGIPTVTEEEKNRAKQIALADPRVQALLVGRAYAVGCKYDNSRPDSRIGVWHDENLQKLGVCLEICFDKPCNVEYAGSQYIARCLFVLVDLNEGKVAYITPIG